MRIQGTSMDRNSEEDDDELDEKSYFPGLNKAHGFFSMIERNQKDRDSYHQEMEEWKQARKLEVKKEWRSEREARRRPPQALYRPPHQRERTKKNTSRSSAAKKYRLRLEIQPDQWLTISTQCGSEGTLADQLMEEYGLTPLLRDTLVEMMLEFAERMHAQ